MRRPQHMYCGDRSLPSASPGPIELPCAQQCDMVFQRPFLNGNNSRAALKDPSPQRLVFSAHNGDDARARIAALKRYRPSLGPSSPKQRLRRTGAPVGNMYTYYVLYVWSLQNSGTAET